MPFAHVTVNIICICQAVRVEWKCASRLNFCEFLPRHPGIILHLTWAVVLDRSSSYIILP